MVSVQPRNAYPNATANNAARMDAVAHVVFVQPIPFAMPMAFVPPPNASPIATINNVETTVAVNHVALAPMIPYVNMASVLLRRLRVPPIASIKLAVQTVAAAHAVLVQAPMCASAPNASLPAFPSAIIKHAAMTDAAAHAVHAPTICNVTMAIVRDAFPHAHLAFAEPTVAVVLVAHAAPIANVMTPPDNACPIA